MLSARGDGAAMRRAVPMLLLLGSACEKKVPVPEVVFDEEARIAAEGQVNATIDSLAAGDFKEFSEGFTADVTGFDDDPDGMAVRIMSLSEAQAFAKGVFAVMNAAGGTTRAD